MDPISAIAAAITIASTVVKTVEDAIPFAEAIYNNMFKGVDVTPEQLAATETAIDVAHAEFQR